jgi:hypothetical protein
MKGNEIDWLALFVSLLYYNAKLLFTIASQKLYKSIPDPEVIIMNGLNICIYRDY